MTTAHGFFDPFNGHPADEMHHITGRSSEGRYFDPDLVVPLTRLQHTREHQSWHSSFADGVEGDARTLRLQRIANLLGRLAEFHADAEVRLPSFTVAAISAALHDLATTDELPDE
jgi:hypothetical protein